MQSSSPTVKDILLSKTLYLRILIALILSVALYAFLFYLGIFVYWGMFGEGASSDEKYHPVAIAVWELTPMAIILLIYFALIWKSIISNNLSRIKAYSLLAFIIFIIHLIRHYYIPI